MENTLLLGDMIHQIKRKPFSVGILEDNPVYLKGISTSLKANFGKSIKLNSFSKSEPFIKYLHHKPEIVIVDFHLDEESEIEGIDLIEELKLRNPNTAIIVLTGKKSISTAINCINSGVSDYIVKTDKAIHTIAQEIEEKMNEKLEELRQDQIRRSRYWSVFGLVVLSAIGAFAYYMSLQQ